MSVKNSLPPYPFLYDGADKAIAPNDGYISSKFSMNIERNGLTGFTAKLELIDGSGVIKSLIEDDIVGYQIRVESSESFFREIYPKYGPSKKSEIQFELNPTTVSKVVQVTAFIVAKKKFTYENSDFNEFYRMCSYPLDCGNIIAITDTIDFKVDTNVDITAEGVISVVPREDSNIPEDRVTVNIEDSSINILLGKKYYDIYNRIGDGEFKKTIISTMIVPATMNVLYSIKTTPEMYEKYEWYPTIVSRVQEICPDFFDEEAIPDILAIAQDIFTGIIGISFDELDNYLNGEDESNGY